MVEQPILLGETARILQVSQETVRRLESQGLLHAVRTSNNVRIFDRQAVEALARERAARKDRGKQ